MRNIKQEIGTRDIKIISLRLIDILDEIMKDIEKFKEDIQNILDKFEFSGETRRKFFSLLVEYAESQQASNPKKGNQK